MVPKLLEVFIIREANVTSLAQMNKIPLPVAEYINQYDRKNADVLARIFAIEYRDNVEYNVQSHGNMKQWEDMETGWMTSWRDFVRNGGGIQIKRYLDSNPNGKQYVLDTYKKHVPNIPAFLADLASKSNDTNVAELKKRADMTFPDGYFWVTLEKDECDIEGGMMQHCGQAGGDMISLRDPQGKPHVTIDIIDSRSRAAADGYVVGKPELVIVQCRGKQNALPDKKYWSYIAGFLKHEKVKIPSEFWDQYGDTPQARAFYEFMDKEDVT